MAAQVQTRVRAREREVRASRIDRGGAIGRARLIATVARPSSQDELRGGVVTRVESWRAACPSDARVANPGGPASLNE
jgi:hypothetical protein